MALIEREKKAEGTPLRIKLEKEHHDRLVRYAEFLEVEPGITSSRRPLIL